MISNRFGDLIFLPQHFFAQMDSCQLIICGIDLRSREKKWLGKKMVRKRFGDLIFLPQHFFAQIDFCSLINCKGAEC